MRTFTTVAAFASAANALVSRSETCCFGLSASGSESGPIGQLDDGQCRIYGGGLPRGQFCIDSQGGITDGKGRGCILTRTYIYHLVQLGSSQLTQIQHLLHSSSVMRVLPQLQVSQLGQMDHSYIRERSISLLVPLVRTAA
jgi:hypothetical protein